MVDKALKFHRVSPKRWVQKDLGRVVPLYFQDPMRRNRTHTALLALADFSTIRDILL